MVLDLVAWRNTRRCIHERRRLDSNRCDAQNVEGWTALLARAPHTRERVVGGRRPTSCLRGLPPRTSSARLAGQGWLAAGDALAAFDPLSSMGIGHALSSGASAARAVVAALSGDSGPIDEYIANSARHFAAFLEMRARYYQMEQRWPHMPFWSRRHGHCRRKNREHEFTRGRARRLDRRRSAR